MDSLILLSSILAGALTVVVFRLEQRTFVKLLNAFTGAYLLSLTFLHLLPELYEHNVPSEQAQFWIGMLILAGFFLQIVLDVISMGVEHGHTHHMHGMPTGVLVG